MKKLIILTTLFFGFSAFAADIIPEFHFVGASITRGVGAPQSLETRIETQLAEEAEIAKLRETTVLFALDYFFVTNFNAIRSDSAVSDGQFEITVRSIVSNWLQNNDKVVVGLLPVADDLTQAQKNFLISDRGQAYSTVFGVINQCCLAKAKKLNQILRSMAANSSDLYLFDSARIIDWYVSDPNLPGTSNMYGMFDRIHINSYGQSVFYNQALKPVLERMWSVQLSPMR